MSWIKVIKNKSYFSRYQVQFRRRRECKTDYQQRLDLIRQDKDKYDCPKYRFVVRKTNKNIICQIVASKVGGDEVLACAYSDELPSFGVKVGLTNYPAAYCTGLLCGRRLIVKSGLDKFYQTNTEVAKYMEIEENEERTPFQCFADIGLQRTSTGANIFGAIKGCADAGIQIPMTCNRLASGYYDKKTDKYNEKKLSERIYGKHISDYMKMLQKDDEEEYKARFSQYIKEGIKADDLEAMYKKAHQEIAAHPIIKSTYKGSDLEKRNLKFAEAYKNKKTHGKKQMNERLNAIKK